MALEVVVARRGNRPIFGQAERSSYAAERPVFGQVERPAYGPVERPVFGQVERAGFGQAERPVYEPWESTPAGVGVATRPRSTRIAPPDTDHLQAKFMVGVALFVMMAVAGLVLVSARYLGV